MHFISSILGLCAILSILLAAGCVFIGLTGMGGGSTRVALIRGAKAFGVGVVLLYTSNGVDGVAKAHSTGDSSVVSAATDKSDPDLDEAAKYIGHHCDGWRAQGYYSAEDCENGGSVERYR